ncbi:MAG: hypothetical protein RL318_2764, partial [Fibrobacterota bacterium]
AFVPPVNLKLPTFARQEHKRGTRNPFDTIPLCLERLAQAYQKLLSENPKAEGHLRAIAAMLRVAGEQDGDALLAATVTCRLGAALLRHELATAVLATLVAIDLKLPQPELTTLVLAALTRDIALAHVWDEWSNKGFRLAETEQFIEELHPASSKAVLETAGIRDPAWLACVLEHSTPPASNWKARWLHTLDRYLSLLWHNAPQWVGQGLTPQRVQQLASVVDPELGTVFIRMLGIIPPGMGVKLANGEEGIVLRRGARTGFPQVLCLRGSLAISPSAPLLRTCDADKFRVVQAFAQEWKDWPLHKPASHWGIA